MKKGKFFILLIFTFLFIGGVIFLLYSLLPVSKNSTERMFEIQKGESFFEIARHLEEEGFIRNKYLFSLLAIFQGKEKTLKAGKYILSSSMTPKEILEILSEGKVPIVKITIPEGWNLKEIAQYLEEKNLCQKEEFLEIVGWQDKAGIDFSDKFDFLKDKPKNLSLEGYLFPDTYFVRKTANCQEIVEIFLKNFSRKLTPKLREGIKRQKKTIFEIVTMASLLEKEVKTKEEKEIVSGILWKRLKYGMPLQVDATITYLTGKKTIKISYEETQIDSPYNTYKYVGLPLGPICNPGMESILAALYPQTSEFWYYLSTPEGKTLFSKTLAEHNIKKAKYLK
jgi:UPF0755 protein